MKPLGSADLRIALRISQGGQGQRHQRGHERRLKPGSVGVPLLCPRSWPAETARRSCGNPASLAPDHVTGTRRLFGEFLGSLERRNLLACSSRGEGSTNAQESLCSSGVQLGALPEEVLRHSELGLTVVKLEGHLAAESNPRPHPSHSTPIKPASPKPLPSLDEPQPHPQSGLHGSSVLFSDVCEVRVAAVASAQRDVANTPLESSPTDSGASSSHKLVHRPFPAITTLPGVISTQWRGQGVAWR